MFALCFGKSTTDSTESLCGASNDPVYVNHQLGRIQEGLSFTIIGRLLKGAKKCTIDFLLDNPNKDIVLRIRCDVAENVIKRNSKIKNTWGTDETESLIPFQLQAPKPIHIEVLMTIECIMIAFNGLHIAKYAHRLPFHDIRILEIRGEISDISVDRRIITDYPTNMEKSNNYQLLRMKYAEDYQCDFEEEETETATTSCILEKDIPLPHYEVFPKGFFELGYMLIVQGRLRARPQVFNVVLQVGVNIWPPPMVALQLEARFNKARNGESGEPIISRNAFTNGQWVGEIKSNLATGLRSGADFTIVIFRGKKAFEIYLNDKPITEYPYHVHPKHVDTVLISGDIKLFSVRTENISCE